jgi:hypothetical protein
VIGASEQGHVDDSAVSERFPCVGERGVVDVMRIRQLSGEAVGELFVITEGGGCGACGKAADGVVGDAVVPSDRRVRVELVVCGPHGTDGQNNDLANAVGQRRVLLLAGLELKELSGEGRAAEQGVERADERAVGGSGAEAGGTKWPLKCTDTGPGLTGFEPEGCGGRQLLTRRE